MDIFETVEALDKYPFSLQVGRNFEKVFECYITTLRLQKFRESTP